MGEISGLLSKSAARPRPRGCHSVSLSVLGPLKEALRVHRTLRGWRARGGPGGRPLVELRRGMDARGIRPGAVALCRRFIRRAPRIGPRAAVENPPFSTLRPVLFPRQHALLLRARQHSRRRHHRATPHRACGRPRKPATEAKDITSGEVPSRTSRSTYILALLIGIETVLLSLHHLPFSSLVPDCRTITGLSSPRVNLCYDLTRSRLDHVVRSCRMS